MTTRQTTTRATSLAAKLARAIPLSEPRSLTPAPKVTAEPTHTSARATGLTAPKQATPAPTIGGTNPVRQTSARATVVAKTKTDTPAPDILLTIRTLGSLLDDLERVRVMNGNRIGAMEREYGEALPHLHVIQDQLAAVEHEAELELVRAWRKHPLAAWAKTRRGVGEKSIARLVAVIGDPADRPNVAKLWAYCGHGDPARAGGIPKGATQEELFKRGNPKAKKQTWLIATSLLKAGNRGVYDAAREKYAEAVHDKPCRRCGPAGKPAAVGSPLSDGHKHARALRATGKAFLKDLWIAASHRESETQRNDSFARGAAQNGGQPANDTHNAAAAPV